MKRPTLRLLCEEPFRLFFPISLLATLCGVALWPLLNFGLLSVYPGVMHARIMTVALAGFLVGFLGTAFPRLAASKGLRPAELATLCLLWISSLASYFTGRVALGDGLFAVTIAGFALLLAVRWLRDGADTPPPGIPMVLVGLLGGGLAAGVLAWSGGTALSVAEIRLAHLLLYQGTALLPLLGIVPYMVPRLLGHPSIHRFDEAAAPPPGWWRRFAICSGVGVVVQGSFVLEAIGEAGWGMGLRAVAILVLVVSETPLLRRAKELTTSGTVARVSLASMIVALGWAAVDPLRRVGVMHLFFVSGVGLVMLGVGVRVVLGHAGRHDLLAGRIVWLRVVTGLALLAAMTRVTVDFVPPVRISHLNYAALTWAILSVLWLWKLRRWFFATEVLERPPKCPRARKRGRRRPSAP